MKPKRTSRSLAFMGDVRSHHSALADLRRREVVCAIVQKLLREGFPLPSLIVRVIYSRFTKPLLWALANSLRGTIRWKDFIDGLMAAPAAVLRKKRLGKRFLEELFTCETDQVWILSTYRRRLTNPSSPLFETFAKTFDTHRALQVRDRIRAGKFQRAWDLLNEMRCGIFIESSIPKRLRRPAHFLDPDRRCYKADINLLRSLVAELYEYMMRKGLIPRMTAAQLVSYNPGWHKLDLPGYVFADLLGLPSPEAKMIFGMADFFSSHRNARRRVHHRMTLRLPRSREEQTLH